MAHLRAQLALILAASLAGCSGADAKQGAKVSAPEVPRFERRVDPNELFPADLDLVIRFDIGRMRSSIGSAPTDTLLRRALDEAGEDTTMGLLPCADVVWIATRAFDVEAGDHVAAVEGKRCVPLIDESAWKRKPSANSDLFIFDRKAPAPRGGTARIIQLGKRATVFVSPVELESVARVLHDGPDERRGAPSAQGFVSLDLRPRRLSPALERKYPSIAGIIAGLDRVRASASLVDQGMRIEAEITARSIPAAKRALEFLEALQKNAGAGRFGALLEGVKLEQIEQSVRIVWVVPAPVLLALISSEAKE